MLIRYRQEVVQDTLSDRKLHSDSALLSKKSGDSAFLHNPEVNRSGSVKQNISTNSDSSGYINTILVCKRNPVADITFSNPDNIITTIDDHLLISFPYQFIDKNQKISFRKKEAIVKNLRPGEELSHKPFHDDWNIVILILSLLVFSIARTVGKSFIPGISRFYLFRGTGKEGVRDVLGIFHWQTTLINLASFFVFSLFCYFASEYYGAFPADLSPFLIYLLILGIIISAVTLRHIVILLTGTISNQESLFEDYLHTFYQSYRFSSFFLFFIAILISYTEIFPAKIYFIAGVIIVAIHYLIRILRLFIIFINRNISIFYLILYLCALEILPVLIIIRFFSGSGY